MRPKFTLRRLFYLITVVCIGLAIAVGYKQRRYARNYPVQEVFNFPIASSNKTLQLEFERYVRCGDPEKGIKRLKVFNQGTELAIESNGRLLVVSTDSFQTLGEYEIPKIHFNSLDHFAVSRQNRVICFVEMDQPRIVYAWNLAVETRPRKLVTADYPIGDIAVSPDGRNLAIAETFDENKYPKNIDHENSKINYEQIFSINIHDTSTGTRSAECKEHIGEIHSLLFAHSGEFLLSASYDETIRVWDTEGYGLKQMLGTPLMIKERFRTTKLTPFSNRSKPRPQSPFLITKDFRYITGPIITRADYFSSGRLFENSLYSTDGSKRIMWFFRN